MKNKFILESCSTKYESDICVSTVSIKLTMKEFDYLGLKKKAWVPHIYDKWLHVCARIHAFPSVAP